MEPRERVLAALDHKEADRVPRDLAGTRYSSIHAEAYKRLRPALGLPPAEIKIVDTTQGLAHVHEDLLERFGADVAPVSAGSPHASSRTASGISSSAAESRVPSMISAARASLRSIPNYSTTSP